MLTRAQRSNRRKLCIMTALVLLAAAAYMTVDVNFGNAKLLAYSMRIRAPKLIVMLITAFAIGGASLVFQSIINNTIVTPCLLGMNSLYTLIHTAVVFCAGSGSVLAANANAAFAIDLVLMGITATLIYSYLFKKTKHNVLYVLLVGTVLTILSRLIARDSGLVDFEGQDISRWKSKELAKRLAILTQSNNIQMKLTVQELVTFGRFPYSGNHVTEEDMAIVERAIQYMELAPFRDRFIDELSGGQRQRALIAMVIAQDTEYVLLDEPTNNLDIYHATNMMKIVRRLCDELGKTVILVLHEINYAAFYSDYICAFVDGRVARFGTVREVMNKEVLSKIYNVDFEILEIEGKPLSIYY